MRLLAFALLLALCLKAWAQLPQAVAQPLAIARIPEAGVAILVQPLDAARPTLALNAADAMNPASVMKLLTAYAALDLLGPAYRWKTEAYATAPLKGDVLEGDLALKGFGDPKLNLESFWMLLRALRGKGLRELRGDLILDRSHFARGAADAAQFDGDPFRPYNVLPDALLVNYGSLRFSFAPDSEGGVRVAVEPRPPALEVVNVLRVAADGACPEGRRFRELLRPTFEPARQRVIFAGRYPASCGEREMNVALLAPDDQVAGVMRQFWGEIGGAWRGGVREGPVPADALLLLRHESAPLGEIVRDMNKFSNNIVARHLFLTLGAERAGPPASPAKSLAVVRDWLARKGIGAPELVLENGSGLSRVERISAATLAALLQDAWRSPVMPEFIASLPVAAVDGTMKRRLRDEPVAGHAHIKTGLLAEVRAMAGYVLDRSGRRHAVVMLVNHANSDQAQPAMDALLRWVYER